MKRLPSKTGFGVAEDLEHRRGRRLPNAPVDPRAERFRQRVESGAVDHVTERVTEEPRPQLEIAQPIDAHKSISRDQTYDWIIELKDGRKISAIDVQRIYLKAAIKLQEAQPDKDREWILREWAVARVRRRASGGAMRRPHARGLP